MVSLHTAVLLLLALASGPCQTLAQADWDNPRAELITREGPCNNTSGLTCAKDCSTQLPENCNNSWQYLHEQLAFWTGNAAKRTCNYKVQYTTPHKLAMARCCTVMARSALPISSSCQWGPLKNAAASFCYDEVITFNKALKKRNLDIQRSRASPRIFAFTGGADGNLRKLRYTSVDASGDASGTLDTRPRRALQQAHLYPRRNNVRWATALFIVLDYFSSSGNDDGGPLGEEGLGALEDALDVVGRDMTPAEQFEQSASWVIAVNELLALIPEMIDLDLEVFERNAGQTPMYEVLRDSYNFFTDWLALFSNVNWATVQFHPSSPQCAEWLRFRELFVLDADCVPN